jgi:hypothetical protein
MFVEKETPSKPLAEMVWRTSIPAEGMGRSRFRLSHSKGRPGGFSDWSVDVVKRRYGEHRAGLDLVWRHPDRAEGNPSLHADVRLSSHAYSGNFCTRPANLPAQQQNV